MMRTTRLIALLVMMLPWLAACSLPDFKSKAPAVVRWRLQPDPPPVAIDRPLPDNLVVDRVQVAPGLERDTLMILDPPSRYDFVANAAWPTDLPAYLRRQLLLDLAGSGHYADVLGHARGEARNWMLALRFADFQIERTPSGPQVHLRAEARLRPLKAGNHVLHRWYELREPVGEMRMEAISAAWNRAWGRFLRALQRGIDAAMAADAPASEEKVDHEVDKPATDA
ncbi:MAG: hypothetical protein D6717_06885 [Gammaproteobacteria bacterium]|nr:MAG: hypothetical protein D6717_06885 [Gammaproteobacteria bacterium]